MRYSGSGQINNATLVPIENSMHIYACTHILVVPPIIVFVNGKDERTWSTCRCIDCTT